MSTGLHVRVARWLRHIHNHSGRQFLSRYFYFERFVKLRIRARVCMINKKQLFHEMLGGERVLSLWDLTIHWLWSFSWLVDGKRGRGEKEKHARNQGKDPSSKNEKKKKKTNLRKQNQFTNSTFSIFQRPTLHSWFWLAWLNSIPVLHLPAARRGEAL